MIINSLMMMKLQIINRKRCSRPELWRKEYHHLAFNVPDDIYYNEDQFNPDDRFHIGNGFDVYAPEKFAEELQVTDL